ncbi:hypothetical protein L195_g062283, partial [Trifolium pratense]
RKRIKINEMLKEIRAALRQCVDSNEPLASSVPPRDLAVQQGLRLSGKNYT